MARRVSTYIRKPGDERRKEILEAALRIIAEHGLEGTTISRIASAVGITPGAIYRHFPSRAALIAEANRIANVHAVDWIASSKHADTLLRLEELAQKHAEWAKENFNTVVRPFFLELAASTDEVERLSIQDFDSFRLIMQMAEEGKNKGHIRKDVPAEDVAWALHMFAWAEDLAIMSGASEAVKNGVLLRNFKRLLETFRPERACESKTNNVSKEESKK